jgi:hypothetical protein
MLNERFNGPSYKDKAVVYLNSAQLRDIDGAIIKSLARVNQLCPQRAPPGPIIRVLSTILLQPVHPWTKTLALKALKNIVTEEGGVSFVVKEFPVLIQALIKLIRENTSVKHVTKSLKVLGAIGYMERLPPLLSKSKEIFIFRSFFTGKDEFKRYFLRIVFKGLFGLLEEPMIETKKECISKVITDLFVADPDSIAQYLSSFFSVFLPAFTQVSTRTLKNFLSNLTIVVKLAGRLIVPHVSAVYQAIEQHWRQQFTVEASRVIRALIEAAYGQCDAILHSVVPICFQLLKFKNQNAALELFKLLRSVSDYTPSYLSIIIQEISDMSRSPETTDNILGLCVKTLKFIVKKCDCVEYLPTIKRCVIKLKNNTGVRYKEAAALLLDAINERVIEDDELEDDEFEPRPTAPDVSSVDYDDVVSVMEIPKDMEDVAFGKWYHSLEIRLLEVSPSPVVRALVPLDAFPGLLPKFSFVFAFLTIWLNVPDVLRARFADFLNNVFKCQTIPLGVADQFMDLIEFSVLSEIDLRLDIANLISFCERMHFWARALFFIENSQPIFPIQKLVALNAAVNRQSEAKSLARLHDVSMDYKLWMDLGDWDQAIAQIRKSVDPARYVYHHVVCLAGLEDWEGILARKNQFYDLNYHDRVQIARYFMTAEMWSGNPESALEFLQATNGFSVEDQIMRAIVLIKMGDLKKARESVHFGWRYLAASVSAIEKCNKSVIHTQIFQAQQLLELSEVIRCLRDPSELEGIAKVLRARLRNIEYDPDKQKEVFKIRSLVPKLPNFDAQMLDLISYYICLGQNKVARRLREVFFPDKASDHAKYVDLELGGREEKIHDILELAESCHHSGLRSRLFQLAGKILLKKPLTTEILKDIAKYYILADKSQEKIADINTLLAHALKEVSYAELAAKAIEKCVKHRVHKAVLFAHKLLGLAVNFPNSEVICQTVSKSLADLPQSALPSVMYVGFFLLLHSSGCVQQVADQLCRSLIAHYPEYSGFQLLSMEKQHSDCELLEELYDKLQMDSAVVFSQVSLIAGEILRISNPLHKRLGTGVKKAKNAFESGDGKNAVAIMKKVSQAINDPNLSFLDKQLKQAHETAFSNILRQIQARQSVTESDFQQFDDLLVAMSRKYESMRVIRLSSVSEHLERKSKWTIKVLGRQSLIADGARLAKFFHCIHSHESGFMLTAIGSDGKRYNFLMRDSVNERPVQIQQFVNLMDSLIGEVRGVLKASVVEISENLHLYEIPKNQISMREMITMYQQSKQRVVEPEQAEIRAWNPTPYAEMTLDARIEVLRKIRRAFDASELNRALLVTSRNAEAWAHRTSEFSSSLGVVSAVCYIIGTVDSCPQHLLIDKVNGTVTFARFSGMAPKQPVPFRLTPMIENAFGRYGVAGPFCRNFVMAVEEIRKRAKGIAPFLQFVSCAVPFDPAELPARFLASPGSGVEMGDRELDGIYARIEGGNMTMEEEFNDLVGKAKDVTNIAQMPPDWCPWW